MKNVIKIMGAMVLTAFSVSVFANPILGTTCGSPDRVASLAGGAQCAYGNGNPDATDITSYYGDVWGSAGELTGDGTNGYLSATSDAGWGVIPNSGTISIDASFWSVYDSAVVTMHIGNGAGDPDHWAWLTIDNLIFSSWTLDYIPGGTEAGGGLSNIKLWGVRGDGDVPEPGMIALLAIGLVGAGLVRRRTKA